MDTFPITSRMLDIFYHINADTFEKQYKDILSGYRTWDELSNGELYTIVTNRDGHGGECCLVGIVAGTKAEDVIEALSHIPEESREAVKEVTLDLSDSMRKIVRSSFPKASRVIDRFHIQKLACDAVQEIRIKHRWNAIQEDNDKLEEAKLLGEKYIPDRYDNGDTKKELLARSRYLLFKSAEKWTSSQKNRAEILFKQYPDLKKAFVWRLMKKLSIVS